MSTSFYAGPAGNGGHYEIAFRENGGTIHWKVDALPECPCCKKCFFPGDIVAHNEYGKDFTAAELLSELGPIGGSGPLRTALDARNVVALVRNGSCRTTSHQAVLRLVLKMERHRRWFVELRKIGGWHISDLQRQLGVW
jgi:hypothetical protein